MRYNDYKRFREQGIPIGNLFQQINRSYELAYEYDREDWKKGNPYLKDIEGGTREKWGIDLSQVGGSYGVWDGNFSKIREHILVHIAEQASTHCSEISNFFGERDRSTEFHKKETYRNMSNAWRDEYALNRPLEGDYDDRMKTSEWRIAQCYYSVYKSMSGLLKSKHREIENHSDFWKDIRTDVMPELGNSLFSFPFMTFPSEINWSSEEGFKWTVPYPMPEEKFEQQKERQNRYARTGMAKILEKAEEVPDFEDEVVLTFFDLLMVLRHWANYWHGGVFSRLFGEGYKQAIDQAVRLISFTGLSIAEVGVICSFDLDTFENMVSEYRSSCELGTIPESYHLLEERLDIYQLEFSN